MAQLSIPQSLIGALIDIADLGTLDYFPPTERCAHWSIYDAQRQELLCPCAPAANTTAEKLFEAAAKILYENFPRYIDSPEEIIPYTSRQELVAALRRGEEEPVDEEQGELQEQSAENTVEPTAEVETSPAEPAVVEDTEVSASVAPKPAAPKPAPSPALLPPARPRHPHRLPACRKKHCGGDCRKDGSDAHHGCSRSAQARCTETCSTQARCAEAGSTYSRCSLPRYVPQVHADLPSAAHRRVPGGSAYPPTGYRSRRSYPYGSI